MSEDDDAPCPICGGCGEVECHNVGEQDSNATLPCPTCIAAEIAEERAEWSEKLSGLMAALKPFADAADNFDGNKVMKNPDEWYVYLGSSGPEGCTGAITVSDIFRARAAYKGEK